MGLAERRAIRDFENNHFPEIRRRIETAAGIPVPVEVRWDTLASQGEAASFAETWPVIYFEPLIAALEDITRDDLGQDAIKEGLKKIVIQNEQGIYDSASWAKFEEGVLTLDHETANEADGELRKLGLIKKLEAGL